MIEEKLKARRDAHAELYARKIALREEIRDIDAKIRAIGKSPNQKPSPDTAIAAKVTAVQRRMDVAEMRRSGMTFVAIAAELGVSITVVRRLAIEGQRLIEPG